jgi:ArsR family metal-binding transcriptional regulator
MDQRVNREWARRRKEEEKDEEREATKNKVRETKDSGGRAPKPAESPSLHLLGIFCVPATGGFGRTGQKSLWFLSKGFRKKEKQNKREKI